MQLKHQSTKEIPTPFTHNHASNLIELPNGDLLCCWFGGSREGKADISILCSRLVKGQSKWTEPNVFKGDSSRSEQNPILFQSPEQELWLLYTAQNDIHQDSAIVYIRKSIDEGYTWSDPTVLFDAPGSFVRNPPIIVGENTIVLPAYYSRKSTNGFLGDDYSVVKISEDQGRTWSEYEVPESKGLVHMSIVKGAKGLIGFFRSRKADTVYRTTSIDGGKTWSTPERTTLPNNNASIQAISKNNGELLLIYNHVNAEMAPPKENRPPWFDKSDIDGLNLETLESATWGVIRSPLKIAQSSDGGHTWSELTTVIEEKDVQKEDPEFSYPSILITTDNVLHSSFTFLREHIQHTSWTIQ